MEPRRLLLDDLHVDGGSRANLDGYAILWWHPMTQNCENMSLSSFWWLQEQQSMSVGLETSHTRCADEWFTSRAQDHNC